MDLQLITEQVKQVARFAGDFVKQERVTFSIDKVEYKGVHDYVSYVDKTSERMIVEKLKQIVPEAGFITEEGTAGLQGEALCWVVDPLDGTGNFIHNNAPFCISIALRNQQEVLVGVVYELCRDELFWACKDSPAYLNGNPIHVSRQDSIEQSFIALGFPYNSKAYKPFAIPLINELYGYVGGLRLMGAAAAETCYVAAGRYEARIEGYIGPWDIAAGSLILKQAGGMMTDFSGSSDCLDAKQVFASNGLIHADLLHMIEKYKPLLGE